MRVRTGRCRHAAPLAVGAVAALAVLLAAGLAVAPVTAQPTDAELSNPEPSPADVDGRLVVNAPIELSVEVSTTDEVVVEFRTRRGQTIETVSTTSGGTVAVTWDPDRGSRAWQAVVRNTDGVVLDATSEQELTVTERDPDDVCLEFDVELQDRNFVCAFVGPYIGQMSLVVLGMIIWGGLSLGLFIRTGSPMIPYVLLLLTGGAISGTLAGPAIALAAVVVLAVSGGVPLLLYIKYAR